MYWYDGSPGAWAAMAFMVVVFWGVIVAAIVVLVRALSTTDRDDVPPANNAGRILDERFAHGEIDSAEYAKRRQLLRSK